MAAYETAGKSDDWYTPKYVFDALDVVFDMDVASPKEGPRYVPCSSWIHENSICKEWLGFVWMNMPFGNQASKRLWLNKFFCHGNGIALVPDRTSAPWFQEFAPHADAILWVSPKIKFERPDGSIGESPGTGTALFGVGERAVEHLENAASTLGFLTSPMVPA